MIGLRKIAMFSALVLLAAVALQAQSSTDAAIKQRAIADLKMMAEAGDSKSQVQLGLAYVTGDGVHKDDTEGVKWLRKAADQDNMVAQRYLAEMYFKGRGV